MNKNNWSKMVQTFSRRSGLYIIFFVSIFLLISILTAVQPAYRFSSDVLNSWTQEMDSTIFYHLITMENRAYKQSFPEGEAEIPKLSDVFFELTSNVKPTDPRTLFGNEIPGFSIFDNQLLMASDNDFTHFPIESNPPLEEVLRDREAVLEEDEETEETEDTEEEESENEQTTGDRDVVFIYNTHNRESFLPHLPNETDPDGAMHGEINITKVSDHLAEELERLGIGTQVDDTDFGELLNERGMDYHQSYEVSRDIVAEAVAGNQEIQYVFDLHRDALRRDKTTQTIEGEDYAKILFVIGTGHPDYEKNLKVATELHGLIEEAYPGLSRGVFQKDGSSGNGVYNQDMVDNALLIEFGGVDNTMEELYRSADALAEVFSDYYWDAEAVQSDS
ncbi:stage II sporulation protein P [Oceanobacillus jeddahense]|uniref:Stage II sporulation protein P n=1 Tax=Oceanobacillus jeddahense TaxID=1462527 RepID=A0ABY5JMT1_9BACI|nr:stage II sporulation protein P [Oceanobacillus jeddahense]UUI01441.1 stage II sporulation protein P [Oceanobacillus jeddahense]